MARTRTWNNERESRKKAEAVGVKKEGHRLAVSRFHYNNVSTGPGKQAS